MSRSEPAGPRRIQRRRTRGSRLPAGTVVVSRPTRWGNPHTAAALQAVGLPADAEMLVALYRIYLADHPELTATAREELAGRDLACWCPLNQPCHADILLEIANSTETPQ